jgi:hypothetical protein
MRRFIISVLALLLLADLSVAQAFPFVIPLNNSSENATSLTSWNPQAAGAEGFVRVRDGHLATDSGRLRLLGVNLVFGACFPTHADADAVASRLSRFGVNAVRLHHMDTNPAPNGILEPDKLSLDSENLDRLDYLIAALARRGIYSDINLHVGRRYPGYPAMASSKDLPDYWKGVDEYTAPMVALQKDYARALLSHKNPYTGHSYLAEPAVAFVEVNNESSLLKEWSNGHLDNLASAYTAPLLERWRAWLLHVYPSDAALKAAWEVREEAFGPELLGAARGGKGRWRLQAVGGAQARLSSPAEGSAEAFPHSLELEVQKAGSEAWHLQLHATGLSFKTGSLYTLSLRMKADRPLKATLCAMQNHAPWTSLWRTEVEFGPDWKDYSFTFVPSVSEEKARLTITGLGLAEGARLELAGASLREGGQFGLSSGEGRATMPLFALGSIAGRTEKARLEWMRFLWSVEEGYWTDMRTFIKDELGLKSLLVGTQVSFSPAPIQAHFDIVDSHAYWQHPRFPNRPWDDADWTVAQSPMAGEAMGGTIPDLAYRRMPGKPFIVTEYNHPNPSRYAAEGIPLLAAYAALQDWDGIFIFDYSSQKRDRWSPGKLVGYFDIEDDPAKMAGLILAAALFRRGDVSPSRAVAGAVPAREELIALMARNRGRIPAGYDLSAELLPGFRGADSGGGVRGPDRLGCFRGAVGLGRPPVTQAALSLPVASDTGELSWGLGAEGGSSAGASAATARSAFLIAPAGRRLSLGAAEIESLPAPGSADWGVYALISLDGKPLGSSRRLLVESLGPTENTDWRWRDSSMSSLGKDWGKAPVLMEGRAARISLSAAAGSVSVWALDERGDRRSSLPTKAEGSGRVVFELGPLDRTPWYEVEVGP